jgi:hypothetical protein
VLDCNMSCLLDARRPEGHNCWQSQPSIVISFLTVSLRSCILAHALWVRCGGCIPHVTPGSAPAIRLDLHSLLLRGLSPFGFSQLFLNTIPLCWHEARSRKPPSVSPPLSDSATNRVL